MTGYVVIVGDTLSRIIEQICEWCTVCRVTEAYTVVYNTDPEDKFLVD